MKRVNNHYNGKHFFDPLKEDKFTKLSNRISAMLKWQFRNEKPIWPQKVGIKHKDIPPMQIKDDSLRVSNIGHVTFLLQSAGINIITDPVYSEYASPVSFAGPKRVIEPGVEFLSLPKIDIILISHNHYDHMDLETIKKLWYMYKPRIITPLENARIIKKYCKEIDVEEYDWGDVVEVSDKIKIFVEPMQHWSARGVMDFNKSLWAAYNISMPCGNIYFVGDSGYSKYFSMAKEKFGAFKLALLPMGAYKPRWIMEYSHMDPYEMTLASQDLGSPYTIPTHYDVFPLASEAYGEAEKLLEEAKVKLKAENIFPLGVGRYVVI